MVARSCSARRKQSEAGAIRTLSNDRKGAVALETAIVAPVFFLAMLCLIQISLLFFWRSVLDFATSTAAREVQVGAVQASVSTSAGFITNYICPATKNLVSCGNITIQVTPSFNYYADSTYDGTLGYCNGNPGQPMIMHVTYMAPAFFGYFSGFTKSYNGKSVFPLVSSAAFVDEWFPAPPSMSNPC